jgi:predicted DNA binding protein
MRELVFELDYRPGWNPVSEALAEHPEATVRSLSCHATSETLWRVDLVEGPAEALDALSAAYERSEYFPDCLVTGDCEATSETRVLDREERTLVVYCVWERSSVCTSVPHLALAHLGDGLLLESHQEGRSHRWRIVLSGDEPVGPFADALEAAVEDVGGMELLRLVEHTPGERSDESPGVDLPLAQRRALHAAVDRGYYEIPRRVELDELAAALSVPRSTLSYRLRRAEARLVEAFVESDTSLDSVNTHR